MANPKTVRAKLAKRIRQRNRQTRKIRETGGRVRGHHRARKQHVAAIRFLRPLLKRLTSPPRIVSAASIGISPTPVFGALGPVGAVTGHHTAGPKDASDEHAISLCHSYDAQHRNQGWGGIGYHYCIARSGTIICLRPVAQKGAHVGNYNTGNVGIMCHGTTGDQPTDAQERSLHWLLRNAHTAAMPAAHRSPRNLAGAMRRGHNDWPGHQSNACPGTHKPMFQRGGRA